MTAWLLLRYGHLRAIDKPSNFKKQYGKRFVDVEYIGAAQKSEIANFSMDGLGENKQFFDLLNSGSAYRNHS